jgi:hypothetical protein
MIFLEYLETTYHLKFLKNGVPIAMTLEGKTTHVRKCKGLQKLVYLYNTDYLEGERTGSVLQNSVKYIPKPKL